MNFAVTGSRILLPAVRSSRRVKPSRKIALNSNGEVNCRELARRPWAGEGALNFCFGRDVRGRALKWRSKELIFFVKVKSNELKIFNILRAYKLKFGPNLGCRTENSINFVAHFSRRSQNLSFLLKVGV